MERVRRIWFAAREYVAWLALALSVIFAMLDVVGLFPNLDWRWIYIVGVLIFAVIMQVRLSSAEYKLKPSLKLVFGDYDSCRMHSASHTDFQPILYRVGLQNIGATTIDNWEVSLERFEPQGAEFLPAPLTVMNHPGLNPDVPLHPSDSPKDFVDVITAIKVSGETKFVWQYAVPNLPNTIDAGRYELTLLAQGKDVPSEQKMFIVDIDDQGQMSFREADNGQKQEI